ncbi:hypothetical protein V6N12_019088 [Hibiscus sabdariffa]|uniref:Uncharacterized protein n=1 Tax=Hibiscus sabdariffa TaxID=183260 RepID=A0ABR2B9Z2_9ROSI
MNCKIWLRPDLTKLHVDLVEFSSVLHLGMKPASLGETYVAAAVVNDKASRATPLGPPTFHFLNNASTVIAVTHSKSRICHTCRRLSE